MNPLSCNSLCKEYHLGTVKFNPSNTKKNKFMQTLEKRLMTYYLPTTK